MTPSRYTLIDETPPSPSALPSEHDLLLRFAAQGFLENEAALLDHQQFQEWLALMTADVVYQVPIRVTRKRGRADLVKDMFHFDEDLRSLTLRVRRLGTDVAWAEDPPSRTRRFVTNVRVTRAESGPGGERPAGAAEASEIGECAELGVTSYLLLYRSRGDNGSHDLISAERSDVLRLAGGQWRLCRREVVLDQSTLGTKNLGVFL